MTNISIIPTTPTEIHPLLKRDFHESAVKPLEIFSRLCDENYYRIFRFFTGETLLGYACLAGYEHEKIRLMDYFAVSPELRSKGYGKILVKALCQMAHEQNFGIVCESENPDFSVNAEDENTRRRRIAFYLSCGAKMTRVTSKVGADNYNVMSVCGEFADGEIADFMRGLYVRFFEENANGKVRIEILP